MTEETTFDSRQRNFFFSPQRLEPVVEPTQAMLFPHG